MKKLSLYIATIFFMIFAVTPALTATASAAPATVPATKCTDRLLGIPTWYRGLTVSDTDCAIEMPSGGSDELGSFIWKIALNIIEMALVIIVYIAIGLILYGGFLFITGGGNPTQVEKARKSIMNAAIGLVISMGAIAIVNFIFRIVT